MGPEAVELSGSIQRIIFHNSENGYSVVQLHVDQGAGVDHKGNVTCVGHLAEPRVGARLRVRGAWVNDKRFGRQLKFDAVEELLPDTAEDIRNFLGSGQIKGLQMELASRIVAAFGTEALRILDDEPERLAEVRGIGSKTLATIVASWREKRCMRDLMLLLQPHGVSLALAVRIYKLYQDSAIEVVQSNPYQLATDMHGVGFVTADSIATKLGFPQDAPLRIEAGILYVLGRNSDDGNVYMPMPDLLKAAGDQLKVAEEMLRDALECLRQQKRVVLEEMDGEVGVFLPDNFDCENGISRHMCRLMHGLKRIDTVADDRAITEMVLSLRVELAEEQVEAIFMAVKGKVMVLTGGPGTGKTTIIRMILRLYLEAGAKVLLAAPTGRAAKRMQEATGCTAQTVHRLLQYNPVEEAFQCGESKPLDCDLLVVDEASMMDTMVFYHLLLAVPDGATLVLVGDVFQLPSVGPGAVLADIIVSGKVPVVELTRIFRQSAESAIVRNAHMIKKGVVPEIDVQGEGDDFRFIVEEDPEAVAQRIVELVVRDIPWRFGDIDPLRDIQVLTPMHKGPVGSLRMNALLQEALNPVGREIRRGEKVFRVGDKVMQTRNDYDKEIFNGDIGRIERFDQEEGKMSIMFDEMKTYGFEDLDSIVPAYAISIHKSQGSEYPVVVLPLLKQHYIMLQRNLIYTAVTRGQRYVVVIGEPRAFVTAVQNDRIRRRNTRLAARLCRALG
jgi:exodeoxyribonuclease V alpha subunit